MVAGAASLAGAQVAPAGEVASYASTRASGADESLEPGLAAPSAGMQREMAPSSDVLWQGRVLEAAIPPRAEVGGRQASEGWWRGGRLPREMAAPAGLPPAKGELIRERARAKLKAKYDIERIGERGIGGGLNFYSLEKEIALGRELAAELEHAVRLLDDAAVTEYINRLGQNLVRNSDARVPFTIKVIDADEINAFALPGGFFYVNTGLILATESEAELAGVMAHEIAHVAARHGTKNATRADIWSIASIPLLFVTGPVGHAVRQAAQVAMPMSMLKFGRNAEREADLLGIEYQYVAGYDPAAFVELFERLGEKKRERKWNILAKAFASHPMNDDRIRRSQRMIAEVLPEREQHIVTTSEYEKMKERLRLLQRTRQVDEGRAEPVLRRRGN